MADRLLDAMHGDSLLLGIRDEALAALLRQSHESESCLRETLEYARRIAPWDSLRTVLAGILSTPFSEEELRDITRFYESPAGQEFAAFQVRAKRLEASGSDGLALRAGIVKAQLQSMSATGMRVTGEFFETPVGKHFQTEYFGPLYIRMINSLTDRQGRLIEAAGKQGRRPQKQASCRS